MNLSRPEPLEGSLRWPFPVDRVAIHDQNDAALVLLLQTHCEALAPMLPDGVASGENLQGLCVFSDLAHLFFCSTGSGASRRGRTRTQSILAGQFPELGFQAGEIS